MNKYTAEIISRGINVDVIGVDMGEQHALAKIVGDRYRAANEPEALKKAITEVFAEVNRKDADDSASSFELLEGIDPDLAKAMIGALAKPQNHPIGEKPRPASNIQSSSGSSGGDGAEGLKNGLLVGGAVSLFLLIIAVAAKMGRHI
jgi:hypothetical protein